MAAFHATLLTLPLIYPSSYVTFVVRRFHVAIPAVFLQVNCSLLRCVRYTPGINRQEKKEKFCLDFLRKINGMLCSLQSMKLNFEDTPSTQPRLRPATSLREENLGCYDESQKTPKHPKANTDRRRGGHPPWRGPSSRSGRSAPSRPARSSARRAPAWASAGACSGGTSNWNATSLSPSPCRQAGALFQLGT